MKYLLKKISLATVILLISSCSVESIESEPIEEIVLNSLTCVDANPEARFINNGTIAFDFKIYDSNMVLLGDFQNVAPGSTTNWTSFDEGEVLFSLQQTLTSGVSDQKLETTLNNCSTLDVIMGSNNSLLENSPIDI